MEHDPGVQVAVFRIVPAVVNVQDAIATEEVDHARNDSAFECERRDTQSATVGEFTHRLGDEISESVGYECSWETDLVPACLMEVNGRLERRFDLVRVFGDGELELPIGPAAFQQPSIS